MRWVPGDPGTCRVAATNLRTLQHSMADREHALTAMKDWTTVPWWDDTAAEVADAAFARLIAGVRTFEGDIGEFATKLDELAGKIEDAAGRAKVALAAGGVAFTVSVIFTFVTVGASEGAAVAALTATEAEVSGIFLQLSRWVALGFTQALRETLVRSFAALAFNTLIPLASEAVRIGTGEWTGATFAGLLIGSSVNLVMGELAMAAQVSGKLSVAGELALSALALGIAGGAGSAATQQALNGHVDLKVVGVSAGFGAGIAVVGAAGAAGIIRYFNARALVPRQAGIVLDTAEGLELTARTGPAGRVTVSDIPGGEGSTRVVQATDGGAMLTESGLRAANLTDSALAELAATEERLAAAGRVTAHADRVQSWLDDVGTAAARVDGGLGSLAATTATVADDAAATAVSRAGGRLQAALADAQAVDAASASEYVTAATHVSSGGSASSVSTAYHTAAEQATAEVHQAATEYAQSLRSAEEEAVLRTGTPDVTQVTRVSPEIQSQRSLADSVAAATAPGSTAPAALPVPAAGRLDPAEQGVSGEAARSAAMNRILANSAWGVVLGGGSGSFFGGVVMPNVESPSGTEFPNEKNVILPGFPAGGIPTA